jgi:hypothetical protein
MPPVWVRPLQPQNGKQISRTASFGTQNSEEGKYFLRPVNGLLEKSRCHGARYVEEAGKCAM